MIYLIYSLIISISINTLIMITPITLGLNTLIIAIVIAITFALFNSSWISFLIFLIYIRGTLVIFSYFVAIAPNITMFSPIHIPLITITPLILIIIFNLTKPTFPTNQYIIQLNTFYTKPTISTIIIIAIILLFTIIVVVKIARSSKGPLRPFNYE